MSHCPKCDTDVSDSYQDADPSVGIMDSGYYCDMCDLPFQYEYSPSDDDVVVSGTSSITLGVPLNQLSGQPGKPGYDEFKRIAKSWGYD